jgi:hypothetical protein
LIKAVLPTIAAERDEGALELKYFGDHRPHGLKRPIRPAIPCVGKHWNKH